MLMHNSVYTAAKTIADIHNTHQLIVRIDSSCASVLRMSELEYLPDDAVETAWDDGISITPIPNDKLDALVNNILEHPDFFPESSTVSLTVVVLFSPDHIAQINDGTIGIEFEQISGDARRIQKIRRIDDIGLEAE